jgi:signal transduction histidine kinase
MVVPNEAALAIVPLELDGVEIARVILLSEALDRNPQEQQFLARTDQALLYAAIAALAFSCGLGFLLARVLTYPLRDLTLAIRAMQRGELKQEVPQESNDEVGEVVQAFNQMSRDIAHANQLRRQMTADIAHDLRSPLTVLSGYAEMMRDGTVEPNRERFDLMFAEAQRLQNLVEDLRTLSLADAGELQLHFGDHSSAEILQAVSLAYQPLAQKRQVTLTVKVEKDLPLVRMDHGRMMQVFNNLVSNALHYTAAGGRITLKAQRTQGGVRWIVEDTGVGIPPDKLPHIFDRSYRVDAARQDGGSGLGLAIARSIVEAHHGLIEAVSEVGRGTRMIVALPS